MKPKVAIVVSHPIQHFCPQYASYAQNENWQTKVFFASAIGYKPYFDPSFKKNISWDNIDVTAFDHEFLNGEEMVPINKDIRADKLESSLTAYDPDVVVTYGYFQKLQREAVKWAKKNKKAVLLISDSELRRHRNNFKKLLKFVVVRWYFSRIDGFLSVGDNNEEYYKSYGVNPKKFFRMHFPIDVKVYSRKYEEREQLNEEYRNRYDIPADATVLSVTGKLNSTKRQGDIIDALKVLEDRQRYYTLLVIGDGADMAVLVEKAKGLTKSRVIFAGFINVNDLPGFVAMTNIYVHPAEVEAHSLSISEAIYMGKPVILSDRCGSWGDNDDVIPGRNGLVYPAGNINALADALEQLSGDKKKMEEFGQLSHQLAVAYQKKAHGDGLLHALKSLGKLK